MLYFTARISCPDRTCRCAFTVCIHSAEPLDVEQPVRVRCPKDMMLFSVPASVLRQAEKCRCGERAAST